jgi:prepilin-type processing-associated H-X9-DG protein
MSEQNDKKHQDEQVLIDYLLGRSDQAQSQAVQSRLEKDAEFRRLHQDIQNTLAAVKLQPALAPPEGLADRTIARLRQVRATDALIARAELGRRVMFRPRVNLRDVVAVASVLLLAGFVYFFTIGRTNAASLRDRCLAQMTQIGRATQAYANENDGSLPISSATLRPWLASAGGGVVSNSTGLFHLVSAGYAPPEIFQCPGTGGASHPSFAVQAGMTDFPHGTFIGYSYQHTLGRGLSLNDPALKSVAGDMAILADSNPLFTGGRFQPQRLGNPLSQNHGGKGQNVLYLDGHARWANNAAVGVNGNNIYLADGVFKYRGDETPANPTDTFLLPTYSSR